jgi:hypothetical protein
MDNLRIENYFRAFTRMAYIYQNLHSSVVILLQ